jgi:putative phosphoribosyl transferase
MGVKTRDPKRRQIDQPSSEEAVVMPFHNRAEAGQRLAKALAMYVGQDVVVLALPRGGVPVGAEIAEALGAPLDRILVRKLGAPFREELAMGAVAEGAPPVTVRNQDVISMLGVDEATFDRVRDKELAEMARRRAAYLGGRAHADVAGRIAIVVDDGVATGATTRAALRAARARRPRKLVLATPVAELEVQGVLRREADEVVCLEDHLVWGGIGGCYDDFRQVSDLEVTNTLARFPPGPLSA